MVGYLDNELLAKENPSTEKPVKKARGGVASRKAKANSMAASAARLKGRSENKPPTTPPAEEESPRPTKAGDLSFVLNQSPSQNGPASRTTPSKSPNIQRPQSQQDVPPTFPPSSPPSELPPNIAEPPPSFTPAEPAHNRIPPPPIFTINSSSHTYKET
jgi:hypothetical protein